MNQANHRPTPETPNPQTPPQAHPGARELNGIGDLVAQQRIDVVQGFPPVPIDVWRVADDLPHHPDDHRCTQRMAQLLIGLFAIPGHPVLSIGHDPALAGAAGAAGLTYRTVEQLQDLTRLEHLAGKVGLVLVPWPSIRQFQNLPYATGDSSSAGRELSADWLVACRMLLVARGVAALVIHAAPKADVYSTCAELIRTSISRAGLGWLQHIIAITTPTGGNQLQPRSRPVSGQQPEPEATRESLRPELRSQPIHADIIMLIVKRAAR